MSDKADQPATHGHLDLEALADVLADRSGVDERQHAAECAECSEQLAGLRSALEPVAASLGHLGAPEQPAELGARLHRAITREQAIMHPTAGAPAGHEAPASISAHRAKKRKGWTALGPLLIGAAALALVGVVVFQPGEDKGPSTTAQDSRDDATRTSSTGTNYDRAGSRLKAALPGLLQAPASAESTSTDTAEPSGPRVADPLNRLRGTLALASCLAGLTEVDDPRLPLALDYASFEGKPALAVVLPADKADQVDVFFVGPACSQGDAQVLHFARLAAPA